MLRPIRFASLMFEALNLGPAYAHVLEMTPKRRMRGEEWLTTQQAYAEFGKVSSVTFPAALVTTLATLVSVRKRPGSAVLTAIGAAGLASTIAIWARFNGPVNKEVVGWTKDGLPPDWERRRDQWEFAHAASAVAHTIAFGALVAALRDGER